MIYGFLTKTSTNNNYNPLLNPEPDGSYTFNAIDHTACFNGGNLSREMCHLSENESILTSPITRMLFRRNTKLRGVLDNLIQDFFLCIEKCDQNLEGILADLPDSWGIDRVQVKKDICQRFDENWLRNTKQVFKEYVQLGIPA